MERFKFIVRNNFPGEQDIKSHWVCISEVESSSRKTQSSEARWSGVKGRGPGNLFINGFHSSLNRVLILCLEKGCGLCS